MKKLLFSLVLALILSVILPKSAHAVIFKAGDEVVLPKSETIDSSAFIAGEKLIIDSIVNGDLFCAGKDVVINSNIKGDVFCAAQNLKINGIVDGNVRSASQTVELNSNVLRNATVASQYIKQASSSAVRGDLFSAAQGTSIMGTVGRDAAIATENLELTSLVGRNLSLSGSQIKIAPTAKVNGNLDYYVTPETQVDINSQNVRGQISRHEVNIDKNAREGTTITTTSKVLKFISSVISFFILGLTLLAFNKTRLESSVVELKSNPTASFFSGLVVVFLTPLLILIVALTGFGLPLSAVLLSLYLIALLTSSIYPSFILGKYIFLRFFPDSSSAIAHLALGLVILWLLFIIPGIGWVFGLLTLIFGSGAYFRTFLPQKRLAKNQ